MYEWYLSDGTCLVDKEAEQYLIKKLITLKELSKEVERVIEECKSLNVIEEDESLSWSVMETSERLSCIQSSLEILVEEMAFKL